MFVDFDLHAPSGRLALLRSVEGIPEITLSDIMSGKVLGEIASRFIPQGPRFSPDGNQLAFFGNGRIYVYSVKEGLTKTVVDLPDRQAGFCTWSPDGLSLAFSARGVPLDLSRPPKIFRVDLADSRIEQLSRDEEAGADVFPQWSPSGRRLVFNRKSYEGPESHTAVVFTDRAGSFKEQLPLADGTSQSISRLCWSPDGTHLLVRESGQGKRRLRVFQVDDLQTFWCLEEDGPVHGCFDPHDQRVLCVFEDALKLFAFPSRELIAELSLSELSAVRRGVTGPTVAFGSEGETLCFLGTDSHLYRWHIGGRCKSILEDEPGEVTVQYQKEEYRFTARDGREIPVHRYLPLIPNGRTVVYVQGGPGGEIYPYDPIALRLLGEGYEVVRPAYRGTAGYGKDHQQANRGEGGRADVWDIVDCGLDWKERFEATDRPLAVAGFSYGGFLTFLALTYPEAPWSCGITLWGATILPPAVQARGLPRHSEERQQAWQDRSPVAQAHRIRFPLLILHGGRDTTATVEDVQSIQARVRETGLPCELVIFEEDTHGLPLSRPEMFGRMLDFLATHSK